MKILFVTYDHPFTGESGVSTYCRDLLLALLERGFTVGCLCVHGRDWRLFPHLRVSKENGVTVFALVNSPLNPEDSIFRPGQDSRQPTIEALARSCLQQYRPDIVHVQTLEGYPGSIVSVAKDLGIPTVVMVHDFWAICPRIGLARLQGEPCDGPNGGLNCLQFCVRRRPLRQQLFQFGSRLPEGRGRALFFAARALYGRYFVRQTSMWTATPLAPVGHNGRLLAQHAARSTFLVQALTEADQLLAVSEFVKSVLVRHAIASAQIRTFPPTLALSHITWKSRLARGPLLRFGFLGRAVPFKGVHVFAEAARDIPGDRARFLVFGPAPSETRRYLQGLSGDKLEFHGPYVRTELLSVLDQLDVVVVPSVIQETVGLVTLEAQAAGVPVIGSRTGAIPEYIRDGENGLLFKPGDPSELRNRMLRFINDPALVAALSTRTQPPMMMGEHVAGLLDIYETLARKRGARWTHCLA